MYFQVPMEVLEVPALAWLDFRKGRLFKGLLPMIFQDLSKFFLFVIDRFYSIISLIFMREKREEI
jgi:hypothetical protein